MNLLFPIKQGARVTKWYAHNTPLNSLAEALQCLSQGFGENLREYSIFGLNGHNGLDLVFDEGTEVFASHDGLAEFTEDYAKGLGVTITDSEKKTIYWHFKSAVKPLGSRWSVKRGELIGYGDSTGYSTGHHLHYGLKLLDFKGEVLNRNNGFDGAINPLPFLVWDMTQEEVIGLYKLAFYRLPDSGELAFWTGKPLSEFLKTAIKDRAEFLNK